MIRTPPTRALRTLATLLCMATAQHAVAQDDSEKERSKHDAVERVVESHDTTLMMGGGRAHDQTGGGAQRQKAAA